MAKPDFLRRLSVPATLIAPAYAPLFGVLALLLGLISLAGWLLDLPVLASLHQRWTPMVINAALGFMLAGGALIAPALVGRVAAIRIRSVLGVLILTAGLTVALEIVFDTSWIDLNALHKSAYQSYRNPGQMAPNTAFCFVLSGLLLLMVDRIEGRISMTVVHILNALLLALGAIGMIGYAISLEFLFGWAGLKPVAFPTATGFVVVGCGTWCLWRDTFWNKDQLDGIEAQDIHRTSDIVLAVVAGVVALISFALSQERSEKLMAEQMSTMARDNRTLFQYMLQSKLEQVAQIGAQPDVISRLRELANTPDHLGRQQLARLERSMQGYLAHGFSAFAYKIGDRVIASAGQFADNPPLSLPLKGEIPAQLLWKDGYILRAELPVRDAQGSSGYLVTEQALPVLTQLQANAIRVGASGDMEVCGLSDGRLRCAPFRWSRQPTSISPLLDGAPLPLARAVSGETATAVTLDSRRQSVMAAFGPIGETGLGLGLKMDMWELYAPIRQQFLLALPFLTLLVAGSVWLMRSRLRPLLKALDASRKQLVYLAEHDALTALPNRSLFHDRLGQAMLRVQRSGSTMALMYLDIDHFKNINDSFGHQHGDGILRWFAQQLHATVRATDTVARLGGDEFTVILENLNSDNDAERIAQQFLRQLAASPSPLPEGRKVGTSIGIAFYRGERMTQEQLLHAADSALYRSKQRGRNKYSIA